jgi:hypothetical protein
VTNSSQQFDIILTTVCQVNSFWLFYKFIFQEWIPDDFELAEPRLYKVGLGMGYLELPQGMLCQLRAIFIF